MIGGIVLAAGRSQRMGTQKLLLPYGGQTIVGHVVDQVIGAGIQDVIVVLGADNKAFLAALAGKPVRSVINEAPEPEMLSSLRCGLRALTDDCEGALVALGDQPGITAEMMACVASEFEAGGRGIVAPVYQGRRGHPIVIARGYFGEVLSQFDGVGLRGLLDTHAGDVHEAAVDSVEILTDLDRPEDYRRAVGR